MVAPTFDQRLGFAQIIEDFPCQKLIPQFAVEALAGKLTLGVPGASPLATAASFVAGRTGSQTATNVASVAGRGVVTKQVPGALARTVVGTSGLPLAGGAGLLTDANRNRTSGSPVEPLEGVVGGIINTVVPMGRTVLDVGTDMMDDNVEPPDQEDEEGQDG